MFRRSHLAEKMLIGGVRDLHACGADSFWVLLVCLLILSGDPSFRTNLWCVDLVRRFCTGFLVRSLSGRADCCAGFLLILLQYFGHRLIELVFQRCARIGQKLADVLAVRQMTLLV